MPLIPAEGSKGWQISEFEASLVFRAGSRTARATHKETLSQNNKQNQTDRETEEVAWLCYQSTGRALRLLAGTLSFRLVFSILLYSEIIHLWRN